MKKDNAYKQESDLPTRLSKPAQRALANAGISKLEQISELSENELKEMHGIGPKAVEQLRDALEVKGLKFANN